MDLAILSVVSQGLTGLDELASPSLKEAAA